MELLTEVEIDNITNHVLTLSGAGGQTSDAGAKLFKENCASCHGDKGEGNREFGAPSLADQIWLYGADKKEVSKSIHSSRQGVMPAWAHRLDEATIKQLVIYVHSLGGGE